MCFKVSLRCYRTNTNGRPWQISVLLTGPTTSAVGRYCNSPPQREVHDPGTTASTVVVGGASYIRNVYWNAALPQEAVGLRHLVLESVVNLMVGKSTEGLPQGPINSGLVAGRTGRLRVIRMTECLQVASRRILLRWYITRIQSPAVLNPERYLSSYSLALQFVSSRTWLELR